MPLTTRAPDATEFTQERWSRFDWDERQEAIHRLIRPLPVRAVVALAARCAERVGPLVRVQPLLARAFTAGIGPGRVRRYVGEPTAYAVAATHSATRTVLAADAPDTVGRAYAEACSVVHAYAVACDRADGGFPFDPVRADVATLLTLNLGAPGELGQPTRWDDPRLGPLWPQGEPAWYTEVVAACEDLERRLLTAPVAPSEPSPSAAVVERRKARAALEQLHRDGRFAAFVGEYVVFRTDDLAPDHMLAHGPSLFAVRREAERTAAADLLVDYFVPSE